MPQPTVDGPHTNPDGTVTTTTTTYWPNGSKRTVTKETNYPDGTPKSETKDEHKKGTGPGADGPKKKSTEVVQDTGGNVTHKEVTTYKDGVKNKEGTEDTEYRNGRPFKRTIIKIQYCPDGTQKKKQTTEVFYWTGQTWRRNAAESSIQRWNCETGEPIASRFPQTVRDYALLILLAIGVFLIAFGWIQAIVAYDIAGVVTLAVVFMLYRSLETDRRENLREDLETERAFWSESDEDQIEIENTSAEKIEAPQ